MFVIETLVLFCILLYRKEKDNDTESGPSRGGPSSQQAARLSRDSTRVGGRRGKGGECLLEASLTALWRGGGGGGVRSLVLCPGMGRDSTSGRHMLRVTSAPQVCSVPWFPGQGTQALRGRAQIWKLRLVTTGVYPRHAQDSRCQSPGSLGLTNHRLTHEQRPQDHNRGWAPTGTGQMKGKSCPALSSN